MKTNGDEMNWFIDFYSDVFLPCLFSTVKRSTDRGKGVKGTPSASIDTSLVTEGTTDVK